jgi:hypothetical protein
MDPFIEQQLLWLSPSLGRNIGKNLKERQAKGVQ